MVGDREKSTQIPFHWFIPPSSAFLGFFLPYPTSLLPLHYLFYLPLDEKFLETNDVSSISAILEQTYEDNLVNELKSESTIERNEKVYGKVSLF